MYSKLIHSFLIVLILALSSILSKTPLASYNLQLSAFLFVVLYVYKKLDKYKGSNHLVESTIFTFVISLMVNTTGGLDSPFFFLLYLLLFSLSLFLEPIMSIITTIALIFFFLFSFNFTLNFSQIIPIISLALITPLAMLMGQESFKERKQKEKNNLLKKNTFLFLSLVLKNHLKNIIQAAENFLGDHDLDTIKKNAKRMEKLIDEYENQD